MFTHVCVVDVGIFSINLLTSIAQNVYYILFITMNDNIMAFFFFCLL